MVTGFLTPVALLIDMHSTLPQKLVLSLLIFCCADGCCSDALQEQSISLTQLLVQFEHAAKPVRAVVWSYSSSGIHADSEWQAGVHG